METTPVPNVFQPGEKRDVEIRFYPRELKQYFERIAFEINGLSTTYIDVSGQGVEMRVSCNEGKKDSVLFILIYFPFLTQNTKLTIRKIVI